MKNTKVATLALCALFTAMTAVLSQTVIPIGAVPFNLATFSVLCAGGILGAKYGALSQGAYILLGIAGVPVFHSFSSGVSRIFGPTGGYIAGYLAAAWLVGFITERFGYKLAIIVFAMLLGCAAYMSLGTMWYMYSQKVNFIQAFLVCIAPFLPGDAVKIAAAAVITHRMHKIYPRQKD